MRARLTGINSVTAKLASGERATYHYHRATGTRLIGEPGSPEFLASIAAAEEAAKKGRTAGTLAGIIREFEGSTQWRKLRESTKSEYRRILKFWDGLYGSAPLAALEDKIFRKRVLAWHATFGAQHPREADNRLTILARVLAWSAADGDLKVNVLATFGRAYESDRSDKIWLPEHVEAFMAVAAPEMQLAMTLALHTGQRQADLLRLAWGNYDGVRISLRQAKTCARVEVTCTSVLKATLDALPKRGPLVLTTKTGRAFQKRYFARQWEETAAAAKIEGLHFHDLRGTTVTLLFEAGSTVGEVAAVTGHSLRTAQQILDRYLARTRTLAHNAIVKLERALLQKGS